MTLLTLAADIASVALLLAAGLTMLRLVIGPTTADRAVAIDMLSVLMVAFGGLRALATEEAAFLDMSLVVALAGFLGTLAFARYIVRRHSPAARRTAEGEPS
jgi:multicomponent Na+:H+ antiporter subunit F